MCPKLGEGWSKLGISPLGVARKHQSPEYGQAQSVRAPSIGVRTLEMGDISKPSPKVVFGLRMTR